MKKITIVVTVVILALAFLIILRSSGTSSFENINAIEGEIEIYKSLTCGCCSVYSQYADRRVDPEVRNFDVQNPATIKNQYGVPAELESCHTTIIEDYFVEGHIPLEAIEKLMTEKPDIAGIAMPGMPSGSPGMPGQKYGDFVIYSVNHDGTYQEFMRI